MSAVAIHQPAYLPWLGYLARIQLADVFVFLDTVQFEKNSFTNRNRLRVGDQAVWLTVPVSAKGHLDSTVGEILISDDKWRKKHLLTMEMNYKKERYFPEVHPAWKACLENGHAKLADLCWDMLNMICGILQIRTRMVRASDLGVGGEKSGLVLNLCQALGATRYISGPQGRNYLDEGSFRAQGIAVAYHDYSHPVYNQRKGEFLPYLGVYDLMCQEPAESRLNVIRSGNPPSC